MKRNNIVKKDIEDYIKSIKDDFDKNDWSDEEPESSFGVFSAIVPYADMMTLLLVFFIFFFMIRDVELGWKMLAKKEKKVEIKKEQTIVEKSILDSLMKLNERVITIPGHILFDSGKADLKWKSQSYLVKVAKRIKEIIKNDPNWQIRIEGHTDNIPINNSKYHSNWELSTARALSIVKFFIRNGYFKPDQMQIMGYGEFKPIVPNDSPIHRQMNRRVEIILYKSYFKESRIGGKG